MLSHIRQYLINVLTDWVSLASGIASVVLLILLAFWGDHWLLLKDNKKTFVWLAVICLVVTGYRVWLKEHQSLNEEQHRNLRPELRIELLKTDARPFINVDAFTTLGTLVTIKTYFVNQRPVNGTMRLISLTVRKDAVERHYAQPLPGKIAEGRIVTKDNSVKLKGEPLVNLYDFVKTPAPLEYGRGFEGWFQFVLLDVYPSALTDHVVKVTITDSFNGLHQSNEIAMSTHIDSI